MSEKCAICRTDLSGTPIYTLPECGHTFHVECAVLWFRSPRDPYIHPHNQQHRGVAGTCPLCRSSPDKQYHYNTRRARVRLLRRLMRKDNTPLALKKIFKKEKTIKEKEKQAILELRLFRKKHRSILLRQVALRHKRWRAMRRLIDIHNQIACFDPHVLLDDIQVLIH
mgnify:CR=1 FL=1